jgi:hypothetical protein
MQPVFMETLSAFTQKTLCSLALTAELIGERAQSASFIYGVMSLLEKLANGGLVVLIQNLIPCLKV